MPPKTEPRKWKPPKGPKNTPHKNKNTIGLGKSIKNVKNQENKVYYLPDGEMRFTTDKHEDDWVKLRSVTQENALDEFLNTAALADTDFAAERTSGIKIVKVNQQAVDTGNYNPYLLTTEEEIKKFKIQQEHQSELRVPRRPRWTKQMTKFELERLESEAFLDWRRKLAMLQQNHDLLLTPFERNIMVWKQLWRVVERSDLVVQIVDARNPLLFRSVDLEAYVKELNPLKRNLLLVNKADLLTFEQRLEWARYFRAHDIKYTFFSAFLANEDLERERERLEQQDDSAEYKATIRKPAKEQKESADDFDLTESDASFSDEDEDEDEELERLKQEVNNLQREVELDDQPESTVSTENDEQKAGDGEASNENLQDQLEWTRIITVQELEELCLKVAPEPLTEPPEGQPKRLQIGLVGYPNVGKSSTINALVGSKKVSVSSTPGKTKHFQTILLSDKVILCDCPGLVFPNFAYTNAELVCNGVLPIDQLREHTAPTQLVAERIPKYFLEAVYGIAINTTSIEEGGTGRPNSHELLNAFARARGFMTQGFGSADESRAARYILKDYATGKLLFVEPPPNEDGSRRDEESCRRFNEDLYTVQNLPEQRKQQVLNAIRDKNLNVESFDLANDLSKLTFSSHLSADDALNGNKHARTYGGKQAAILNSAAELDNEFFKMNQVQGSFQTPFHSKSIQSNKKHNKANKKKAKKLRKASVAA
ncbi:hypothetical protein OGAPHI_002855 [Ogataea philodendri]|uniref:CP-type G domain-containing protein n=1 Tax=Ogataea philodendri TaxID=1378263 RepID=A0A9P8T6S0_9ASCO|nr:uncharacterized protein OGAPHI_002855 [Ogataea philodendri]KAH3667206.1 hypothetical protein OGAPHI_002855 [Ogataea philodendri]